MNGTHSTPITDQEFKTKVVEGGPSHDKLQLVDFWAEWCGPCRALGPTIETLAQEYQEKVEVFKMDIDANPETPSAFGIRSIPTVILFKGGRPVARLLGAQPKVAFEKMIQNFAEGK
ncbi:MAG: thioredoxin [Acidobacteria bacterium]|nr:MAG: thioredoxin [Acidobacteriota bacterium]